MSDKEFELRRLTLEVLTALRRQNEDDGRRGHLANIGVDDVDLLLDAAEAWAGHPMTAEGLTEVEREQVALACDAMFDFGDTWIRFLRDGNETVLLPVVERILADRLAAVQAERDMALSAAASMDHFADVAERVERRNNELVAERDALREVAGDVVTDFGTLCCDNPNACGCSMDRLRTALDADR